MSDSEKLGEAAAGGAVPGGTAGRRKSDPNSKMSRVGKVRLVLLVLAVAVGTARVVIGVVDLHHAESPQAEGYHQYGTVRGTTFWLRPNGTNAFLLRTTGSFGGQCAYSGPDLTNPKLIATFVDGGYLTVCDVSGLRGPRMIVDLVSASAGPVTVQMSDGTTIEQTGSIDPSLTTPTLLSAQLLAVVITDDGATVEGTTFG